MNVVGTCQGFIIHDPRTCMQCRLMWQCMTEKLKSIPARFCNSATLASQNGKLLRIDLVHFQAMHDDARTTMPLSRTRILSTEPVPETAVSSCSSFKPPTLPPQKDCEVHQSTTGHTLKKEKNGVFAWMARGSDDQFHPVFQRPKS